LSAFLKSKTQRERHRKKEREKLCGQVFPLCGAREEQSIAHRFWDYSFAQKEWGPYTIFV